MKYLSVVFAIIVVVQFADVGADKIYPNDPIETHEGQQNIGNNQSKIATDDMNSLLLRKRNCKKWCVSYCRNRFADILSFAHPIEAYEEQQNIKINKLKITSQDMMSLSRRRKCVSACLSWYRS